VVQLAQRHRLQRGDAGGRIAVGDEQHTFGRWVQRVGLAQQFDPGHALQRLVSEQQCDLLTSLVEPSEHLQGSRWGVGADDLVVQAEPSP
jgi:hypothetical protein